MDVYQFYFGNSHLYLRLNKAGLIKLDYDTMFLLTNEFDNI